MGIGHVSGARCALVGPAGKLVLDTMPFTGLVITHPLGELVTDSGAGATALATGAKTNCRRIATREGGIRLQTIADVARETGRATGIMTTDKITGATPAPFVAHVEDRGQQGDIAAQIVASRVDVALGTARQWFLPKTVPDGEREDGRDLIAEARKRGYDVVTTAEEMDKSKAGKLLGLFASIAYEDPGGGGPTMAQMTSKAIAILSRNKKGFFLMAEEAHIDGAGHSHNQPQLEQYMQSLDDAVRVGLDFAKKHGDTLVLVTADHETGGLVVRNPEQATEKWKAVWALGGHSANMVPLYAYGPGAELFSGTHQNTDVPKIIAGLWGRKLKTAD